MEFKHPSKDIKETKGNILKDKIICVCVTGSVAAVNTPALCRELMRWGAEVYVVMNSSATKLIHPDLLHWATGNKVILELTGNIEHIALAGERPGKKGKADLILVAPSTANTISKIACGIDDTPVTTVVTTAFGSGTPIIIVPAMHESMYKHPILEENIKKLQEYGVDFIFPRIVEGKAKIAEIEDIAEFIKMKISTKKKDLIGLNFLLTAGAGREFIDRVRFISNPSSGKMGLEIANEIISRGGKVTIISGFCTVKYPSSAEIISVVSTSDFLEEIKKLLSIKRYNAFISSAAISDFRPIQKLEEKVSSTKDITITLKPTPKIIDEVRKIDPNLYIAAFKAESDLNNDQLIEKAYNRLKSTKLQLIVANNVNSKTTGFQSETNEIFIINDKKEVDHVKLSSKRVCAGRIIDQISKSLKR